MRDLSRRILQASNRSTREEQYWLKQLDGDLKRSHFPYDPVFPSSQEKSMGSVPIPCPPPVHPGLMKLSNRSDTRLFIILAAALTLTLHKYTGNNDIILGVPIFKQTREADFINTVLPLRNRFTPGMTFKQLLLQVHRLMVEADRHQNYPIDALVGKLKIDVPETGAFPLFDAAVLLENVHDKKYLEPVDLNVIFSFSRNGDTVEGLLEFNRLRYSPSTVERIASHFRNLLQCVLADVEIPLSGIDILSRQEKQQLLLDFNDTGVEGVEDKTVIRVFEDRVEKNPGHTAVAMETLSSHRSLTYRQLNEYANRLGRLLRRKGVQPGTPVGVLMDRSIEAVAGMMGILKAGGVYFTLAPDAPGARIESVLNDSCTPLVLTDSRIVESFSFTALQGLRSARGNIRTTPDRKQIDPLDRLPFPNRSLIDCEKYNPSIGQAMVSNCIALQATRGCPYNCTYCHKVWPKTHVSRSAEHIFREIQMYYNIGVRRFAIVDDIFNLDLDNSKRFFQLIIQHRLKLQLFFPNGMRGDLLTPGYIDLMVKAGTAGLALSLETASPRLQKLIRKHLNVNKLEENIRYFGETYPHVILELFTMHGFPTETEEEAKMTLDFIKRQKNLHFPYVFVLKIYADTDMAELAMQHGISSRAIYRSESLAFHELPDTLPFDKQVTMKYQAEFTRHFLSKDRLLKVLPLQMRVLTENEMVQKYDSYLPVDIKSFDELLAFFNIRREELGVPGALPEDSIRINDFNRKVREYFPPHQPAAGALKVLLLDLSQFFAAGDDMLYDVEEPPLGLMYLLTYLNRELGTKINGKIAKSRIDFAGYPELKTLLEDFRPDVIGIRTLTFYKNFFHQTIAMIRQWGISVPIVAGGPYATSSYKTALLDRNIDVVVLGEGEETFCRLIEAILRNNASLPQPEVLEKINGIAFLNPGTGTASVSRDREVIMLDCLKDPLEIESKENPEHVNQPGDPAYIIFTSGSSGVPKGVIIKNRSLNNLVSGLNEKIYKQYKDHLNVSVVSPFVFDASVKQVFAALLLGHSLFPAPRAVVLDARRLLDFYRRNRIDISDGTPTHLRILMENSPEDLAGTTVKHFLIGGETLPVNLVRSFLELTKPNPPAITNVYGPSECCVDATYYEIPGTDGSTVEGTIPIGKPMPNVKVFILGKENRLQPIGIAGELCISGSGVARGYLNNPELTAGKFIDLNSAYTSDKSYPKREKIYKSGDLARWLPDGNIEFLGRIDFQVKVRGFRVELGEIEHCLRRHHRVEDAVVLVKEDHQGNGCLAAYVKMANRGSSTPSAPDAAEMSQFLAGYLPRYMIPSYFMKMESFPLTANGKIDRRALPAPHVPAEAVYAAPRSRMEKELVKIWSHILDTPEDRMSIDANFFHMGGHSLKTVSLVARIHKCLNIQAAVEDIFSYPTIRLLAEFLENASYAAFKSIEAAEKREYYPLSSAQKRLYVLHRMKDDTTVYNLPQVILLRGMVQPDRLAETFEKLIARHESLRTSFHMAADQPVQRIHDHVTFEIEYQTAPAREAGQIDRFIRPFDLANPPLLRVCLLKTGQQEYLLLIDMHHIISDAISNAILKRDFMALSRGEQLPGLTIQYKDFSLWQDRKKETGAFKNQEAYWLEQLKGEIPLLDLPHDRSRPLVRSFEGGTVRFQLGTEETASLKQVAAGEGATMFMVLFSLYNILLWKLTGQEAIVVGSPVSGRSHSDLEQVIGMFVNTQVLKSIVRGDRTYLQFLKEVKKKNLEAIENQDYQLEDLVEKLAVHRDAGRNPLFDVAFTLQNHPATGEEITDAKMNPLPNREATAKFDMTLFVVDTGEKKTLHFEYSTELYDETTIRQYGAYYLKLAAQVAANPGMKLSELDMLSEAEKRQLLEEFNGKTVRYPEDKTIHQLFVQQAQRTPDSIALAALSRGRMHTLSYRQLDTRADQVARELRHRGLQPGDTAGINIKRSQEMVTGILGILKAGAAYLPHNPKNPEARIKYQQADSRAAVLLTEQDILNIDPKNKEIEHRYRVPVSASELAYIIYTSGSTGNPKGVPITHGNFCQLVHGGFEYGTGTGDRTIQNLSYYFDWSVWEIFITLTTGAALCVPEDEQVPDPEAGVAYMRRHGVTVLHITPTQFQYILDALPAGKKLDTLTYLFIGAEKLTLDQVKRSFQVVSPRCRLFNMYGPTEATIISAVQEIRPEEINRGTYEALTSIPIGKPLGNATLLILDKNMNLCPIKVPGELYISGGGVSRGYLNNPELTAEKFAALNRSYKTGDLARWLPDGSIEFLERIDHQVKIRGLRVELGEIENRLSDHPEVKEAAAVVKTDRSGEPYLCAYIVSHREIAAGEIREYLAKELPDYMIPPYFVFLEKMPLNANAKIDRKALPEPVFPEARPLTPPRDRIEKKLAELWWEVLFGSGTSRTVSIDDDFFESGGHSIKATQLAARIHKTLNIKLPLVEIFTTPTIRALAHYIRGRVRDRFTSIQPAERKEYYALSSGQKRLYILQQLTGENTAYNMPAVFELEGNLSIPRLEETFLRLIQRHQSLRTSFHEVDGQPVQVVHEVVEFAVAYSDLCSSGSSCTSRQIQQAVRQSMRPFDLSRAPLIRLKLVKIADKKNILIFDMHHIISDGSSYNILVNDFIALNENKKLQPLRLQYKDYSEWQNREKERGALKQQEEFWLKEFEGDIPVLDLPADYARPAVQGFEGDSITFELASETTQQLKHMVMACEVTMYVLLMAIYNVLLAKLSSQEDIVLGSDVLGRRHADLEHMIGMFVNILPMRNYPTGAKPFNAFLKEVKTRTLDALENQEYPFEDLVDLLVIHRDASRNPLFDTVFSLHTVEKQAKDTAPTERRGLKRYEYKKNTTKFDLLLTGVEKSDGIHFTVEYSTKLFKRETIDRFVFYFKKVIALILENASQKIEEIEIITGAEKRQLLFDFNNKNTAPGDPKPGLLHEIFEQQVNKTPDSIAVVHEDRQVSYSGLNERANRLAKILRKKGIAADTMVVVLLEQSLEIMIALLGVLKAGGAYLPIDPAAPKNRILSILEDSLSPLVLTKTAVVEKHAFTDLQGLRSGREKPHVTAARPQITDLDHLPLVNRNLVDYDRYNSHIGDAMVKNTVITLQTSRGCPYNCAYCHKIWPKSHYTRSAENILEEVQMYYDMGVRRFAFVDDIFNLKIDNSMRFFEMVIKRGLDIQMFFPSGFRGDILTREFIDKMIEAGTVCFAMALETASPRLQKLIGKHLNIERFRKNIEYVCKNYPHVILELFTMHGLPTETEEEALMTLNFIKDLQWVHFPYINILRIYSNTDMERLALQYGISRESITRSESLAFHELPETLPFDRSFTLEYQADFLGEYFLSKDRLLHVLPQQIKLLTEDEIVQKYNSYLPTDIKNFTDLVHFAGISFEESGITAGDFLDEDYMLVPGLNRKMNGYFPPIEPAADALKVLLLDLSQFFSAGQEILYDLVDPPLGLMYLLTYLEQQYGSKINGKIAKSRIDFDSYADLKRILAEFKPDVIGIRALTFYKDFFHKTVQMIRQWKIDVPIIAGGPHATSNYEAILQDRHIDLVVLGEGEITFSELIGTFIENKGELPGEDVLKEIPGIAFKPGQRAGKTSGREVIMMDALEVLLAEETGTNPEHINQPGDLAYVIFTSGSLGKPKGVMVEHRNVRAYVNAFYREFEITANDRVIQQASPSFDAFVEEVYPVLFRGGKSVIMPKDKLLDIYWLTKRTLQYDANIISCSPLLLNELNISGQKSSFKLYISGGDVLKREYVDNLLENADVYNTYGPTETTVCVTYHKLSAGPGLPGPVPIGKPIANYKAYILDKNNKLLPVGVPGELCVSGPGVTRGYLNRPRLTAEKFISSPFTRLYRTGDLTRWQPEGTIEFLGRIDQQVKIRGYRIELAEIEKQLIKHDGMKDLVVLASEDESGEKHLCAYFVSDTKISVPDLRKFLAAELPDYMIPAYFVELKHIPLTANGKINRKALPRPELELGNVLVPPRDRVEERLVEIWSDILGIKKDKIGIDHNFFEIGGHSLRATNLVSRIHKEFDVKLPLAEVFKKLTIRKLGRYVRDVRKEKFYSIEPVEKREYYPASSAQKRMFLLNRIKGRETTSDTTPEMMKIEGRLDKQKLEDAFKALIKRHETLRTSFHLIDDNIVQIVHQDFDFSINYIEVESESEINRIARDFITPFDLGQAPLLRINLVKLAEEKYLFMFNLHHIITDGTSSGIFFRDLLGLYENARLPVLHIQYKDFAAWHNTLMQSEEIRRQQDYWLNTFSGDIPVLDIPTDFPRPPVQVFEGNYIDFKINTGLSKKIKDMTGEKGITLYMVLLAIYNIMLSKYSGQEDIIVGAPIQGRRHADLENLIGFFINTVAIRNYPRGEKKFNEFLEEVRINCLNAYENQDYQFDELIAKLELKADPSRQPLFSTLFEHGNMGNPAYSFDYIDPGKTTPQLSGLKVSPYRFRDDIIQFDLLLHAVDTEDAISFRLKYSSKLFKIETIEGFARHLTNIAEEVTAKPDIKISEIEMFSGDEVEFMAAADVETLNELEIHLEF